MSLIRNKIINKTNWPHDSKGFTLIEIMVALMVVTLVLMVVLGSPFGSTDRSKLSDTIQRIQKNIKLAQDESILNSKVAKLSFSRSEDDEDKMNMVISLAQDSDLLLMETQDTSKMSFKELEAYEKKMKDQSSQFKPLESEFDDIETSIELPVYFLGAVFADSEKLVTDNIDIYFFPSGEKDLSALYLATTKEIAQIDISSFKTHSDYQYFQSLYNEDSQIEPADFQLRRAKTLFERWKDEL